MTASLPEALVNRIAERLKDDWRRTGDGDWLRTPKELRRRDASDSLAASFFGGLVDQLAAAQQEELKPIVPLPETEIEKVERKLGFALPAAYRALVHTVGDGGYGPYNGIRRLANWAKDYAKLRTDMPSERGRDWPEGLLPIVYLNGRRICLDRDSGAVILWTKPPKKASEKKWRESFVPQSASLAEWLERWVDLPTEAEGGPPGGWDAPEGERQRRAAVEQERADRQAAAEAKARQFTPAALPPLDAGLVEALATRANDPHRRTDLAGLAARARPVDLDALSRASLDHPDIDPATKQHIAGLAGAAGALSRLLGGFGLSIVGGAVPGAGAIMMRQGAGGTLGVPLEDGALDRAEQALGVPLPEPVRQLYRIADGGFGPGPDGLMPLDAVVRRYRQLTGEPQGPNGEPWPARLLPLAEADPATYCLDLEKGSVVVHDVQEMDHLGRGQWARSFATEADSLGQWLARWTGPLPG